MLLGIHKNIKFALCSVDQARRILRWQIKSGHFIAAEDGEQKTETDIEMIQPLSLITIHRFASRLQNSQQYKEGKTIVVCAGIRSEDITNAALLVGCFMILSLGQCPEAVWTAFKSISHRFVSYADEVTVQCCWRALHKATLEFDGLLLDTQPLGHDPAHSECGRGHLDMAEAAHYDSPLNGGFHVVFPGELLALDCPADLPGGAEWADAGGERRFGARFYAGLFAEMGVGVVVR